MNNVILTNENFIVWFAVTGIQQHGRLDYHGHFLNYPKYVLDRERGEYFNVEYDSLPKNPGVYKLHMNKYDIVGINNPSRKIGYKFEITYCNRICGLDLE